MLCCFRLAADQTECRIFMAGLGKGVSISHSWADGKAGVHYLHAQTVDVLAQSHKGAPVGNVAPIGVEEYFVPDLTVAAVIGRTQPSGCIQFGFVFVLWSQGYI